MKEPAPTALEGEIGRAKCGAAETQSRRHGSTRHASLTPPADTPASDPQPTLAPMIDFLEKPTVLVLNRHWQAIAARSPADAFCQLMTGAACGLDIDGESMNPVRTWAEWLRLGVRAQDRFVRTVRGAIRVPTVVVLTRYAQVPRKRPTFSARAIWERDGRRCQYTGRLLKPGEGNIDHIVPRSRGGATDWENCVLACKQVNSRKADRLPSEAGLNLLRTPKAPRELPVTLLLRNSHGIADWELFLGAGTAVG